jgi:hypothetical protein
MLYGCHILFILLQSFFRVIKRYIYEKHGVYVIVIFTLTQTRRPTPVHQNNAFVPFAFFRKMFAFNL